MKIKFINRLQTKYPKCSRPTTIFALIAGVSFILVQAIFVQQLRLSSLDKNKCDIAVAVGSDANGTRGLYALINSIIRNYNDSTRRTLCIFVFTSHTEFKEQKRKLSCIFDKEQPHSLNTNVRVIPKVIQSESWNPPVMSNILNKERNDLNSEYNWFRWYLKPQDIDGLSRVIWLDTDTVVNANIAELYDWNLNSKVAAAVSYYQPLHMFLCDKNPELHGLHLFNGEKLMIPQDVPTHLNAGVLLLDLEQMEKQYILQEWNRLLQLHEQKCLWNLAGQPDFQLSIRGKYEELPEVWNIGYLGSPPPYRKYSGDACRDGKILHWNGSSKPWNSNDAGCVSSWQKYDLFDSSSTKQCLSEMAYSQQKENSLG